MRRVPVSTRDFFPLKDEVANALRGTTSDENGVEGWYDCLARLERKEVGSGLVLRACDEV